MRISIRHETRYDYDEPVSGAVMRLRLVPPATACQIVGNWRVCVNDTPIERWTATGYGDVETVWRATGGLGEIGIVAQGEVATIDKAGVSQRLSGEPRPLLFLRGTKLTAPSPALAAFAAEMRGGEGPLASLHALMGRVHGAVAWKAGVTTVATTAAEALEQGAGVCQDQSHVFIAAARLLGIPARYVTGYLRDPERPDDDHAPHAWAEAWVEDIGWIGFDCSLGHCPGEGHVRLAIGLDAADAAPIRMVIAHGGDATLSSDVQISNLPLDGSAQAHAQQ